MAISVIGSSGGRHWQRREKRSGLFRRLLPNILHRSIGRRNFMTTGRVRFKRVVAFAFFWLPAAIGIAQESVTQPSARPSGFHSDGYLRFSFYPPHNEFDLNIGAPFPRVARYTGRYSVSTDFTLEHSSTPLFGELNAFLLLGNSLPMENYSFDPDPYLIELEPTVGWRLSPEWDVRLTYGDRIDLGNYISDDLVDPWLAASVRARTYEPMRLGGFLQAEGYLEGSIFAPGFEYPASQNTTPPHQPFPDYLKNRLVRARYELELEGRLQPQPQHRWWRLMFLFMHPRFFLGNATADNSGQWNFEPLTLYFEYGAGLQFGRHLEFRISSAEWMNLGGALPDRFEPLRWMGLSLSYVW
jgi:hypothetical protein